jgi:prevent-host-death family protein
MKKVGVRELKSNLSSVLREVHETDQIVEVTRHGEVIARIEPVPGSVASGRDRDANGAWSELKALATEISAQWPQGVSAQDAINDARREL